MRIEVLLQRVHVGALKWRLPAWWTSTPNPQCTSLREANANLVCVGGLLQTDPQERAKASTACSDCRPRPTVPDPVVSQGNSQMQVKAGQTSAGESTSTQHRSTKKYESKVMILTIYLKYPIHP